MSVSTEKREATRLAYTYCCGYCGLSETDIGSKLDIDHYQPTKHNGTDDLDNLVYTCPACNRFKGEYWPQEGDPDSFYLLHPDENDVSSHIVLMPNGRLAGITPRGWFHLRWLHLNRPQSIARRRRQQREHEMQATLLLTTNTQHQLQARVHDLEQELFDLQEIITQLT